MMTSFVSQLSKWFEPERVLGWARESGWCKRQGKIIAAEFLQSGVFGQLSALKLTLNAVSQNLSQPVTRQAVDQRFTPQGVEFFKLAFQRTMQEALGWQASSGQAAALQAHFKAIRLFDSSTVALPDLLKEAFPGCGGVGPQASLKVLLEYEYSRGQIRLLDMLAGKCSDQGQTSHIVHALSTGELGLMDAGFYKGSTLSEITAKGAFFVIPWPHSVLVHQKDDKNALIRVDIAGLLRAAQTPWVEFTGIFLGGSDPARLGPVRLVAYRLREEVASRRRAHQRERARTHNRPLKQETLELAGWLILITNASAERLPARALGCVYRCRWQIELLFKQFKSILQLDKSLSQDPYRRQCEIWARLIAAIVVGSCHRCINALCWARHQCEISFLKLANHFQQQGSRLVQAFLDGPLQWIAAMSCLCRSAMKLARKEQQPSRPTTWENLQTLWLNPKQTNLPEIPLKQSS